VSDKRTQIIEVASRCFEQSGFHATGISDILREADVAKRTLYHHFASKDELVVAVLSDRAEQGRVAYERELNALARTPRGRMLAAFDIGKAWFEDEQFSGCIFVNAVSEHYAPDSAVQEVCAQYKRRFRDTFERLAREGGYKNPGKLADQLALLFEGAIVTAQVTGAPEAAETAKEIAAMLLDGAEER